MATTLLLVLLASCASLCRGWGIGADLTWEKYERVIDHPGQDRIVGGSDVHEPVPWMVTLGKIMESTGEPAHFCGGALIHKNWVLTAAHCLLSKGVLWFVEWSVSGYMYLHLSGH